MENVLVAQILLRQLRHGQVAGQVNSVGQASGEAGAPSPLEFLPRDGVWGRGGLLRLVCDKRGACGARAGGWVTAGAG